nr:hypothetical protein GCM10010200_017860 [Actinomadura rugatobispora]
MSRARAALSSAAVALAAAASAPLLAAGYDRPSPVIAVLAVTGAVAVAVTSLAHRLLRGLGPAAVPAGLPVASGWLVALAAWSPGPVREPVPAALDAALHSGARILTTAPQAPVTVDLLAFPVLAVWLAGAIATVLHRDGRALPALLPGAVLLCGAAALNPEASGPGYRSAALLSVAAALLLTAAPQARPDTAHAGITVRIPDPEPAPAPRRPFPRTGAAAVSIACAVTLPGAAAAVAAPGVLEGWPVRAADPRTDGAAPERPRDVRNPLAYLSAWAAEPDVPLLNVSGPRASLRWVALAEFTGPTWLPDSTYRPAGPALPSAEQEVPPHTSRTTVRVSVRNLPGDWVPVPGIPTRIDGIAVGHDAASGTLLSSDGPVTGRAYTAAGMVPDWSGRQASGARAASANGHERYLRLPPGAPPRLAEIARSAAGDGTPHRRASRLAEYLRDSYTFEPGAPGGHGYAELADLLIPPGRKGGGATSEQFASAFAVLARAAGLPSRVVVGFGPGGGDGERVVRTGDAVAWGEIYFDGLGWVPYDPNPRDRSKSSPRPRISEPAKGEGTHRDGDARDAAASSDAGAGPPESDGRWTLLLALPALLLVGIPLLRLTRIRRLRRGTATDRVLAAWTELLVAMRLASLPVPASATAADLTACLAREVPGTDPERLRRLGALVNAAGFGGTVTPKNAVFAVAQVRTLATALRCSRSPLRRLSWWWDPRALLWSAQPSRLTRRVQTGSAWATRSTSTTATTVKQ